MGQCLPKKEQINDSWDIGLIFKYKNVLEEHGCE